MAADLTIEATQAKLHPGFIVLLEERCRGLPWESRVRCKSPVPIAILTLLPGKPIWKEECCFL